MELTYSRVGDYLLPDLILRENPENFKPLGLYAQKHHRFLQEHRPALYSELVLTERLWPLLREIEETATARQRNGVSEEVIYAELIYD